MKLVPHLLKEADYTRKIFDVRVEPGTDYDEILKPVFWAHVARRLKSGDRIEIRANDGSWFAELMVRSASHVSAVVSEMRKVDFSDAKTGSEDADDFQIKHRGAAGWSAIRKSDKKIVTEGHETREAVAAWLKKPQPLAA